MEVLGDFYSTWSFIVWPECEPKSAIEGPNSRKFYYHAGTTAVTHFADPPEMQIRACFASAVALPPALQEADQ